MNQFQVILADDHAMFRRGLRKLVEEIPGLSVVGEACDGLELLNLLKRTIPHLVILDISMPHLRGIEAVKELKALYPEVKTLILTMHKDREYLYHALSAGAEGYLLKEDADTELAIAIKALRQGRTYLSPIISSQLPDLIVQEYRLGAPQFAHETLTIREREIIKLIGEGKSNREIADLFFISIRTVQHHRANLMRKLNLKRTADLVKYAINKGYL